MQKIERRQIIGLAALSRFTRSLSRGTSGGGRAMSGSTPEATKSLRHNN